MEIQRVQQMDTKRKSPEDRIEKIKRQLGHIILDTDFYMNDGYKEFVLSMHNAIGNLNG